MDEFSDARYSTQLGRISQFFVFFFLFNVNFVSTITMREAEEHSFGDCALSNLSRDVRDEELKKFATRVKIDFVRSDGYRETAWRENSGQSPRDAKGSALGNGTAPSLAKLKSGISPGDGR